MQSNLWLGLWAILGCPGFCPLLLLCSSWACFRFKSWNYFYRLDRSDYFKKLLLLLLLLHPLREGLWILISCKSPILLSSITFLPSLFFTLNNSFFLTWQICVSDSYCCHIQIPVSLATLPWSFQHRGSHLLPSVRLAVLWHGLRDLNPVSLEGGAAHWGTHTAAALHQPSAGWKAWSLACTVFWGF